MTNEQMAHTVARLIDFAIEPAELRYQDGNLAREWADLAGDDAVTREDFAFMLLTAINVTAGLVDGVVNEVAPLLVVDVSARTVFDPTNAPTPVINVTTTLIDGTPGPGTMVRCASRS